MIICQFHWEKWYGKVTKPMSESLIRLELSHNEDFSGVNLVKVSSLENIENEILPPESIPKLKSDFDSYVILDMIYGLEINEKVLLKKWLDCMIPTLIEWGRS
jgi:hypothetical protein